MKPLLSKDLYSWKSVGPVVEAAKLADMPVEEYYEKHILGNEYASKLEERLAKCKTQKDEDDVEKNLDFWYLCKLNAFHGVSFAMIGRMDPLSQTLNLAPTNYYNYKNQEAFAIREAMENTWDPQKHNELFRKLYELTCREVPYMINFNIHNSIALKPHVKGYDPNFDPFGGRVWNYYFEK